VPDMVNTVCHKRTECYSPWNK